MAKCADCGAEIDIQTEYDDFIDYVNREYGPDSMFDDEDPRPFGPPLCTSCMINFYESEYHSD